MAVGPYEAAELSLGDIDTSILDDTRGDADGDGAEAKALPTWWQTFYLGGTSLASLSKFPPCFAIVPRALSPGGDPGRGSLAEERRFRRWWYGGRCVRGLCFGHRLVITGRHSHGDV